MVAFLFTDCKSFLPEQKVCTFMYQLCKSIYHMHRNGIFHRDVKPENILVKVVLYVGKLEKWVVRKSQKCGLIKCQWGGF